MRYNKYSKSKKIFEYLVDKSRTWITKDQLRISLSSILVAEPKGNWLPHKGPILEILNNRLLTEHISNSAFSLFLEPSKV
jgi:hypothetical protein